MKPFELIVVILMIVVACVLGFNNHVVLASIFSFSAGAVFMDWMHVNIFNNKGVDTSE